MCDAYLGEIRMFGGSFAPESWLLCDGSILNISEYNALFSLLGARYGGNGSTTFALPDLRGRLPIGQGQGAGLTNRVLAQSGGTELITLNASQVPIHNHTANAVGTQGSQTGPGNGVWATTVNTTATPPAAVVQYIQASEIKSTDTKGVMDSAAIGVAGGSQPHNNVMPCLTVNYIICVTNGIFPTPNP